MAGKIRSTSQVGNPPVKRGENLIAKAGSRKHATYHDPLITAAQVKSRLINLPLPILSLIIRQVISVILNRPSI